MDSDSSRPKTPADEAALPPSKRTLKPYRKIDAGLKKRFIEHMEQGATREVAARLCNVTSRAVRYAMKRDKKFYAATCEARDFVDDQVELKALKRVQEGSDTMIIWWLKNRRPLVWRDRHEYEYITAKETAEKNEYRATLSDDDEVQTNGNEDTPLAPVVPLPARAIQKPKA
jgi:hypothetical protein